MTAIAPNGVTVANYDPTGIGAIVFASIAWPPNRAAIALGDTVAGADLTPCAIWHAPAAGNHWNVMDNGGPLPGTWKCLGATPLTADATSQRVATLWIRVA